MSGEQRKIRANADHMLLRSSGIRSSGLYGTSPGDETVFVHHGTCGEW
jgi:hypothetical protein